MYDPTPKEIAQWHQEWPPERLREFGATYDEESGRWSAVVDGRTIPVDPGDTDLSWNPPRR